MSNYDLKKTSNRAKKLMKGWPEWKKNIQLTKYSNTVYSSELKVHKKKEPRR